MFRKCLFTTATILFLGLAGCSSIFDICIASDENPARQSKTNSVWTFLIAEAMSDLESGGGTELNFEVVFLSLGDDCDPSVEFLHTLPEYTVPIRPFSESERRWASGLPVSVDAYGFCSKTTKQQGIVVFVSGLEWHDENEASLTYGWHFNSLSLRAYEVRVKWNGQHWEIKDVDYSIIS